MYMCSFYPCVVLCVLVGLTLYIVTDVTTLTNLPFSGLWRYSYIIGRVNSNLARFCYWIEALPGLLAYTSCELHGGVIAPGLANQL